MAIRSPNALNDAARTYMGAGKSALIGNRTTTNMSQVPMSADTRALKPVALATALGRHTMRVDSINNSTKTLTFTTRVAANLASTPAAASWRNVPRIAQNAAAPKNARQLAPTTRVKISHVVEREMNSSEIVISGSMPRHLA